MSRVHDVLRSDKEPLQRRWYLKIHDGTVYGPVELSVLNEWAGQSRIAPGNLVSENRIDWFPVQDIPELRMEWLAHLPHGETYGPFNVLAVPHLVQNGILPDESTLTNNHSGKTLQVKDLLKHEPAASTEQIHKVSPHEQDAPAEQHRIDAGAPLIKESQIQSSKDKMQPPSPPVPVEIKPPDEPEPEEKPAIKTPAAARDEKDAGNYKKEISRLERESEQLKARLESAQKELKTTRDELANSKQKTGEDLRNVENASKQAVKKEQDLNRVLDETRRKAESEAAALFKIKTQLEELKNQKTELQNRTLQEEARLKATVQELEKQIQALQIEIQSQKTQYQSQEKDLQARQDKIQAQASQFKEKADTATAELKRFKQELEAQRSFSVDIGKSSAEREAALSSEIRTVKAASAKAESELAAIRKQYESLKGQSSNRDAEFQNRTEQLNKEIRSWITTTENLRKELSVQQEECRKLEKRAKNFETDIENNLSTIGKLQEEKSTFEARNKKLADEIARQKVDVEVERKQQAEARSRYLEEKGQLSSRIEQFQTDTRSAASRIQDIEKLLSIQKADNEKLKADLTAKDRQNADLADQLKKEMEAQKAFRVETQKTASEKETVFEKEIQLAKASTARLEKDISDLRKQNDMLAGQARQKEIDLQKRIDELSNELLDRSVNVEDLRKELAAGNAKNSELATNLATLNTETERLRTMLGQAQAERLNAARKAKKQEEEAARQQEVFESDRKAQTEQNAKLAKENADFSSRIKQLESENQAGIEKSAEYEKLLNLQKKENEKLLAKIAEIERHSKEDLGQVKTEFSVAMQKYTEERRKHEAAEKQSLSTEAGLRQKLEETVKSSAATVASLEKTRKDLADTLAISQQSKTRYDAVEHELRQEIANRDAAIAGLETKTKQQEKVLKKQKDHYEAILDGERQRGRNIETSVSEVELRLQGEAALLEEKTQKLDEAEELLEQERERFALERKGLEKKLAESDKEKSQNAARVADLQNKVTELEGTSATIAASADQSRKELEVEREWRQSVQNNISLFEDKLQTDANQITETTRDLDGLRNKLTEERERFSQEKALLEERIALREQEKTHAVEISESLEEQFKKLQDQLTQEESLLSEAKAALESEHAQRISIASTLTAREAELQAQIDELKLAADLRSRNAGENGKQAESPPPEASRIAELEQKMREIQNASMAARDEHERLLVMEQKKNEEISEELKKLRSRQKGLEAAAAAAKSETVAGSALSYFSHRYSLIMKTTAVIILIACSFLAFVAGRNKGYSKALVNTKAGQEAAIEAAVASRIATTAEKPNAKQKAPPPRIDAPRTITFYTENSCTIMFDYGLFSTRTNLMSDALTTLEGVAAQIKGSLNEYKLIIEGHSDTVKTGSAVTPEDNYKLGLARANWIMDILKNKFDFPEESMIATSTGENDPPFPNTDEAIGKKNRTVVLKLVQR